MLTTQKRFYATNPTRDRVTARPPSAPLDPASLRRAALIAMATLVDREEQARCVALVLRATRDMLGPNARVLLARQRTLEYLRKRGMRRAGTPDAWKIGVAAMRRAGIVETVPSTITRFIDDMSWEEARDRLSSWIQMNAGDVFEVEADTPSPPASPPASPRGPSKSWRWRRRKQTSPQRAHAE